MMEQLIFVNCQLLETRWGETSKTVNCVLSVLPLIHLGL